VDNIKSDSSEQKESRELFTSAKLNNLSYSPIEDFFSNPSWPLPEHDLEQSPCRPIIITDKFEIMGRAFYRCKIHPNVWSPDLTFIEYHCKYQEPDRHKAELSKLLSFTQGTPCA
jgi:hypothetical protein